MTARIRDTDRGLKALMKRFKSQAVGVTVGVHEAEGAASHGDEVTNLDVALFHEFGTEDIPERSFIRAWSDENEAANRERLSKIGEALVKGKVPDLETGLARFGVLAVADVQKRMVAGIPPELSPVTIARKGSSTPLIDTGQLKSSISFQVKKP